MKKKPVVAQLNFFKGAFDPDDTPIRPLDNHPGRQLRRVLEEHGFLDFDVVVIVDKESYDEIDYVLRAANLKLDAMITMLEKK